MRKTVLISLCVAAVVVLVSCEKMGTKNPVTVNLDGSTKMMLSMQVNPDLGVVSGAVTISKGELVQTQYFDLDGGTASVLFTDLQPGIWQIHVELYDEDGYVLYEGNGEAGVVGGQTTTAQIVVEELSGGLEVVIEIPDGEFTYIVHPDGTGDFATIQEAIDACVDDDIVALSDGVFTGLGNRNIDYLGKSIVVRSLSGDPESCVIDCEQLGRGFHFHSGESNSSRLEGITIINGIASDGGGVYCHNASPTIRSCTFVGNHSNGGYSHGGGGLCCQYSSSVIESCTFSANTSTCDGAAIDCEHSSLVINDCDFLNNENGSYSGGAIRFEDCSDVQIADCLFQGNTTGNHGGGMIIHRCNNTVITDCILTGNSAGAYGGGMLVGWGDITIINCIVMNNTSEYGGGIDCYELTGQILDCIVAGNSAPNGGGMSCRGSEYAPSIIGCTIVDNHSTATGSGLVCADNAEPALERCIVAFNTGGEAVSCVNGASVTLSCVDVFGNSGGDWVGCIADQYGLDGNISEDPLFCDAAAGDYTIDAASPCAPENSNGCELIGALPVACGQ